MAKYKLHKSETILVNVHSKKACKGEYCCIHNPSNHHMADWPQVWRADRKIMERVCEHGVGHPDFDQIMKCDEDWIHGCDSCCTPPTK